MKNTNIKALLGHTYFFADLNDEKLDQVFACCNKLNLAKGDVLYEEGDVAHEIYLLVSGEVQLFVSDGAMKKYVLSFCVPGDMMGVIGFIDNSPHDVNCCATENSIILAFSRQSLMTLFGTADGLPSCAEAKNRIIQYLVASVRGLSGKAKSLALVDVYGRVRALINQLLIEQDGMMVLRRQLTQQEIADQIGSSREMVARVLKELVFGNYIRLENRRIIVLKMLPISF
ncbi:Crp/Fnr family transcriptional regulator [Neisseriaceae bacterium TC5R-5]|nr:Crp/Fnr family transcriptional regulator [Neisseriaceae bacterium TC5R-5]